MSWYEEIAKPAWAPPAALFGTVWSVLYPIIFLVYGYVAYRALTGDIPKAVLIPIVINLVVNFAFTPIQFGLRNFELALVDIILTLLTIGWSMWAIWPFSWLASAALIPYLIWVCIATVLQFSITVMNR